MDYKYTPPSKTIPPDVFDWEYWYSDPGVESDPRPMARARTMLDLDERSARIFADGVTNFEPTIMRILAALAFSPRE